MNFEETTPAFQRDIRRYYKDLSARQSDYFETWQITDELFRSELGVDEDEWVQGRMHNNDSLRRLGFPGPVEYEIDQVSAVEKVALMPLLHLGPYIESRSRSLDELRELMTQDDNNDRMIDVRDIELWYTAAVSGIARIISERHGEKCLVRSYKNQPHTCARSKSCPYKLVRNYLSYEAVESTEQAVEYEYDPSHRAAIMLGKFAAGALSQFFTSHEEDVMTQSLKTDVRSRFDLRI